LLNFGRGEGDLDSVEILSKVLWKRASSELNSFTCMKKTVLTFVLFVPGIGIISFPCARSQANATCPEVALCFVPIDFISSAMERILGKF